MPKAAVAIDQNILDAVVSGKKVGDLYWALSHNAFNSKLDAGKLDMNQAHRIEVQLGFGVRALELDVHYNDFTEDVSFGHYYTQHISKGIEPVTYLNRIAEWLDNHSKATVLIIKFSTFVKDSKLLEVINRSRIADKWFKRSGSTNVCDVNLGEIGVDPRNPSSSKFLLCDAGNEFAVRDSDEYRKHMFGWDDSNVSFKCQGNPQWPMPDHSPTIIMPEPMPMEPFIDMNMISDYDPRVAAVAGLCVPAESRGAHLHPGEVLFGRLYDVNGQNNLDVQQTDGNVVNHKGLTPVNASFETYDLDQGSACALVMHEGGWLERHIFHAKVESRIHEIHQYGKDKAVRKSVLVVQETDGNAVIYPPGLERVDGTATWASQQCWEKCPESK